MLSLLGKKKFNLPEPRIIDLKEPIKIVGLSIRTNTKAVYKQVPALGKKFHEIKKAKGLSHRKQPWAFAAVTKNFYKDAGTWTYIIGDVVTGFNNQPADFISFQIPAGKYALFTIRPKNRFFWGWTVSQAKNQIYANWLPESGYVAGGEIDDFEYHDERSLRDKNPEIDLYVAIKPIIEEESI